MARPAQPPRPSVGRGARTRRRRYVAGCRGDPTPLVAGSMVRGTPVAKSPLAYSDVIDQADGGSRGFADAILREVAGGENRSRLRARCKTRSWPAGGSQRPRTGRPRAASHAEGAPGPTGRVSFMWVRFAH